MRTILSILFIALLFSGCQDKKSINREHQHSDNNMKQAEPVKKNVLSPHSSAMAMLGDAHIHIDYSSPGVRDRIIFGGLLAYDQVWQSGAHKATWIESNKDLSIDGKLLPAGKYGLFTIPSKNEWTIIINSNWNQHGKDEYDENDDVIRFKVTPLISENIKEQLEYEVNKVSEGEGTISLAWEKVAISFNFMVNH